jgi:Arc/MetJ family transcription regulator
MRRTQLYLDDDLWSTLHAKARLEGATVSELVRVAVRERYLGNLEERRQAMLGIIGLWKDRDDLEDTETMVRRLRGGTRLKRAQAGLRAK